MSQSLSKNVANSAMTHTAGATEKLSPPYARLKLPTKRKANQMNELALEQITKATCLVCGDKLAPFEVESQLCIMCED